MVIIHSVGEKAWYVLRASIHDTHLTIFTPKGELLYLRLLGQNFIILNSEKVARALLDQRSSIYSDRPVLPTNKSFVPLPLV